MVQTGHSSKLPGTNEFCGSFGQAETPKYYSQSMGPIHLDTLRLLAFNDRL